MLRAGTSSAALGPGERRGLGSRAGRVGLRAAPTSAAAGNPLAGQPARHAGPETG